MGEEGGLVVAFPDSLFPAEWVWFWRSHDVMSFLFCFCFSFCFFCCYFL